MTPAVSVIIPAYNRADLIGKTLQGVLAQTLSDLEVVVVDDGSTDGTADVVNGIVDPRIRYHYQENSGLPAGARNTGIRLAEADVLAFLDSDDVWYPNKLARCMEALTDGEGEGHTQGDGAGGEGGAGLVCHGVRVTQDARVLKTRAYMPDVTQMHEQLLLYGNFLSMSAVVVKKRLVVEAGGFSIVRSLRTVEDYDLWLRLAARGARFKFIADVLGEYVIHPENATAAIEMHHENLAGCTDTHLGEAVRAGMMAPLRAARRRAHVRAGMVRALGAAGQLGPVARNLARLPLEFVGAWAAYRKLAKSAPRPRG